MRYLTVIRRFTAALARALIYGALGLSVLAVLAIVIVPRVSGLRFATILSDSMRPTMTTGDMIVVRPADPAQIEVGDVILFRTSADPSTKIAHRVVEIVDTGDSPAFVTKGDANETADRSPVPAGRVLGRVQFHVPLLGYVTHEMKEPLVFLLALALPGSLIVASEMSNIVRVLKSDKRRVDADSGREP